MEDNNIMPEILANDLIKTGENVWSVRKVNKEFIDEIYEVNLSEERMKEYLGKLYYDYYNCVDCYYSYISFVDEILEDVTAIYKKVGKDYICIWEKT